MENKDFAFSKTNFILIGISMLVVVVGFLMMIGASSNETQFDADIFSGMRTKVAPVICFIGFVSIVAGIMYHPKKSTDLEK